MIRNFRETILHFLRGIVMGVSDVIPGVSGGTMALVLGIYEKLVNSIKKINLSWFLDFGGLLVGRTGGRRPDEVWNRLNLPFLLPLGLGIVTAIVIGSQFIPGLLANYPEIIRGFFLGLIVASVWIPLRRVSVSTFTSVLLVLVIGLGGILAGYYLTSPSRRLLPDKRWVSVQSEGGTFKRILRRGASSLPAYETFWSARNSSFRESLRNRRPGMFKKLQESREDRRSEEVLSRKEVLEARSQPYHELNVPQGISVEVPRIRMDYTFGVGVVSICAMILPGISGSYILLILGAYFFVMNILKGFIEALLQMQFLSLHAIYILLFVAGACTGLALFSRVLDYFLENWHSTTMALLTGLMIGCLRGVWPFRRVIDGHVQNVAPNGWTPLTVAVGLSVMVGIGAIVALYSAGAYFENEGETA